MGFKLVLYGTVAVLVQSISSQCIGNLNAGPIRQFGNGPYGPNPGFNGPLGPNPAGLNGPLGPNPTAFNGPLGANSAAFNGLLGQNPVFNGALGPNPAFNGALGPNPVFNGPLSPNLGPVTPGYTASTGGSFPVTSASPVSPSGVSVLAENLAIEGPLVVGGQLPFLGTVRLEGTLPGAGVGSVSYGCGNGNLGIISENSPGIPGPYGLAGNAGLGYDAFNPIGGQYGPGTAFSPLSPGNPAGVAFGPGVGQYGYAGSPLNPAAGIGSYGLAGAPLGPGIGPGFAGLGPNGLRN